MSWNQQPSAPPYNPNVSNGPPAQNYQYGNPSYSSHPPAQNYHYGNQQPAQNYGNPSHNYQQQQYGHNAAPNGMSPQIWHWFLSVDSDRSGTISAQELSQALLNANWTPFSEEACRIMISLFDQDQDGQINPQEFQALLNYMQQWRTVFERYDRDRSGSIDSAELHTAWQEMGYRVSPQLINTVVARFDKFGRRSLSLDAFIQACLMLKGFTDSFRAKDTTGCGVVSMAYEEFLTIMLHNRPNPRI